MLDVRRELGLRTLGVGSQSNRHIVRPEYAAGLIPIGIRNFDFYCNHLIAVPNPGRNQLIPAGISVLIPDGIHCRNHHNSDRNFHVGILSWVSLL